MNIWDKDMVVEQILPAPCRMDAVSRLESGELLRSRIICLALVEEVASTWRNVVLLVAGDDGDVWEARDQYDIIGMEYDGVEQDWPDDATNEDSA